VLKTKNLTDSAFLTIREIRTKALVETRIEHAAVVGNYHGIVGARQESGPRLPKAKIPFDCSDCGTPKLRM
jgi:hypothetical protein